MSGAPLVSIGLPVYNGDAFVERALDSLCAQDYEHLEIIVSDNASTDNTAKICRAAAEREPGRRVELLAPRPRLPGPVLQVGCGR
jgi:glycosyltransferase involved in cell wall biosynthesis